MQRFYQGQLDFFCAIYAVINALTALYGINLTQARSLFASMLGDLAKHPGLWQTTLANKTDFHWLVAHMLLAFQKGSSYPVRVFRPFGAERDIPESAGDLSNAKAYCEYSQFVDCSRTLTANHIWSALEDWLPVTEIQPRAGSAKRVVVLRFHRYIRYAEAPVVSHWSVADHHHDGVVHLRDASKEESALFSFGKDITVFTPEMVSETHNVRIEPESLFFIERR